MTADKHVKRRVRERARRTGESYTAALRVLRHAQVQERTVEQPQDQPVLDRPAAEWERHDVAESGYAISLPAGWLRRPPDLRSSPAETARFVDPVDRRHGVTVFRHPVRPGRTPAEVAEGARTPLEAARYEDVRITAATVGRLPAARLDCCREDGGQRWSVVELFVVLQQEAAAVCLAFSSTALDEDEQLLSEVSARFELLPRSGQEGGR